MPILTKEEILQAADLVPEELEVPEWGGSIRVRGLDVAQRTALLEDCRDASGEIDTERITVLGFIAGVVEPEFTEEDYEALRARNSGVMDNVVRRVLQLSGIDVEQIQAARENFSTGASSRGSSRSRRR